MAPRSRSGCLTCRSRKLKCSEEKPVCAQCAKAHRECVPSSGITFRHQQNPSMNANDHGEGSLKSFYGYKETFAKETTWVPVPKALTFKHTNNPYDDEDGDIAAAISYNAQPSPTFESSRSDHDFSISQAAYHAAYATHGLEALSAVASQDQYSYASPPMALMTHHESSPSSTLVQTLSPQQSQAPSQNLDFILNPSAQVTPQQHNIDPRLHMQTSAEPSPASPSHVRTHPSSASANVSSPHSSKGSNYHPRRRYSISDPQLAFLLRDFSVRSGHWMDLFDLDHFFSSRVPVLAVECPLLLYSCAALSCKSLARINGGRAVDDGLMSRSRRSIMEQWPGPSLDADGWKNKGIEYYDLAVSLLRQALAGASRPTTSSLPDDLAPQTISFAQGVPLPATDSDEVLASIAILCVYEFLDGSASEWSRHLDGAKTLLDILRERLHPLTLPSSPTSLPQQFVHHVPSHQYSRAGMREPSQGQKAVFWNFARQDMLSAFIGGGSTRLDTEDIPMWRNAGLRLTADNFVCPSNPDHPDYLSENAMADDMISNALVWILAKLINLLSLSGRNAVSSRLVDDYDAQPRSLLYDYEAVDQQLQIWYSGLPDAFHVPAVGIKSGVMEIEEMWFPRPMCASTMQWYHFAKIQLLSKDLGLGEDRSVFDPEPSASVSVAPSDAMRRHAREIVAISLGRSDEGTRVHSVQPLWAAGQVLGTGETVASAASPNISPETQTWRATIVNILRGISSDMGWETAYRIQNLLELWQLPGEWPDASPDDESQVHSSPVLTFIP